MARPIKQGLDYFPFDVQLLSDFKFMDIRYKYGCWAIVVYIALLELCYKDKGYYIDYSNKRQVILMILDSLKGKYQPTAETVENVIEDLVASELFSVDHFKKQIITSKRIQIVYYTSKKRGVMTDIKPSIWMLSIEEMKGLGNSEILKNFINVTKTKVNVTETRVNETLMPQSKEKKSKVKQSKEKESNTANNTQEIVDIYNSICTNLVKCSEITKNRQQAISECEYSLDKLKEIFEKANKSDFLAGKNSYGFKATFDWLMKKDNAVKVVEGAYDNTTSNTNTFGMQRNYTESELKQIYGDLEDPSRCDF